jgi:hypothetical protein
VNRSVIELNVKGIGSGLNALAKDREAMRNFSRTLALELEALAARGGFRVRVNRFSVSAHHCALTVRGGGLIHLHLSSRPDKLQSSGVRPQRYVYGRGH